MIPPRIKKIIGRSLAFVWRAPSLLWAAPIEIPKFRPITENLSSGPPLLNDAISAASLSWFLTNIFKIAIAVGAILAVLRIAYGGFVWMTTDAVGAKQNARTIIQNAALGLILLLAVVVILERINPNLLNVSLFLSQATEGGESRTGSFSRPLLPTAPTNTIPN